MSEHTKGPWAATSRKGDDWDSVVYIPGTPNEICQCFHDPDNVDECEANAHLISAAPDLLKACKAIDTFYCFFNSWTPPELGKGAREALEMVADAKAEGK